MPAGRMPIRDAGCRCTVQGISQVDISGMGSTVGIVDLQSMFDQLYKSGKKPDESILDELMVLVKTKNYVPNKLDAKYRAALLREYKSYCHSIEQRI
ncbi:MAG: hypothetical protein JXA42_14295 [Anaerolineales bacterium]|nr:hypothetical protein [Anaerolineales bacterium]